MNTTQIDQQLLDRLYELLSQNQFELLQPFDTGRIRLVYLMNDAVESFLVFEEAVLTGFYDPQYEGELGAELRREEDGRYVLMMDQGENVCTIFFRDLSLEIHPYNYGRIGHVWMKGHEDLRQIEYWIAIMKAKRDYLGEGSCSALEIELSELEAFPPLNVCSFPAVPRKYYEPREDAWVPSPAGMEVMEKLAREAGDAGLLHAIKRYKKHHGKQAARRLAGMLCRNGHSGVVELLIEKIREAASIYPDRVFEPEENERFVRLLDQAERRQKVLQAENKKVYRICQTPFLEARDDVEFKVHLLVVSKGVLNRKIEVETFEE